MTYRTEKPVLKINRKMLLKFGKDLNDIRTTYFIVSSNPKKNDMR